MAGALRPVQGRKWQKNSINRPKKDHDKHFTVSVFVASLMPGAALCLGAADADSQQEILYSYQTIIFGILLFLVKIEKILNWH